MVIKDCNFHRCDALGGGIDGCGRATAFRCESIPEGAGHVKGVVFPHPFNVSLSMLRFHQILRPQELLHTFPLLSPVNLTCYY